MVMDIHVFNRSALRQMRTQIKKHHIGIHFSKQRRKINPDTGTSARGKSAIDEKFVGIQWATSIWIFGVLDDQISFIPGVPEPLH